MQEDIKAQLEAILNRDQKNEPRPPLRKRTRRAKPSIGKNSGRIISRPLYRQN